MAQKEWIEKDYYGDLGVTSSASAEEIKKAYRKIAREDHPDKKPGDAAAEARFKRASEAYSVVGDKEKRREYDELKSMAFAGAAAGGGMPGGGFHSGFNFDTGFDSSFGGGFSDVFGDMFGGARRSRTPKTPTRGADVETEITLDFREATKGATVPIRLSKKGACEQCSGTGSCTGKATTCGICHGTGLTSENRGAFGFSRPCPDCSGTGERISDPCTDCDGTGQKMQTRTITVRVPAGVVDGQKVRLAGQGAAGLRGKPSGDLFVTVHVTPDKVFSRSGDDLKITVPVSYTELVLGAAVAVPTLDSKVRVRIPQGTPDGTTLRVKGHGVNKRNGNSGDLLVTVKVAVPKERDLDEGAISALRRYAEEEKRAGFDPRRDWEGNR